MRLTSIRDLLAALGLVFALAIVPALLVADGASALEPLRTAAALALPPGSAAPSVLLGLGALVALAFYGRPRRDP